MDMVSHALLGIAVAGFSGQTPDIHNQIYIAAVLGSQAPDADIVALLRGKLTYLKQHRACSHSFLGVFMWAAVITAGMGLCMPALQLKQVFIWALLGGLSHSVFDYFNTHGAALFWPIIKERKSFPLLNVFDPVLFCLLLYPYVLGLTALNTSIMIFLSVIIYIVLRCLLRFRAVWYLKRNAFDDAPVRVWVMPSLKGFYLWDYVVETPVSYLNGYLGVFKPLLEVVVNLPKRQISNFMVQIQQTILGKFFSTFTPYPYFEEECSENYTNIYIYDLRYFSNQKFIHQAKFVFSNEDNSLCESCMHSLGQTFEVNG